jgi:hypothetical protein
MSSKDIKPRKARYLVPDDAGLLWHDWKLSKVLSTIEGVLADPDRPVMAVPSTQDVIRLISDTLDIALQCLGEDHWAEARVNPEVEVGETDVSVEGYAISIDPSTGRPTARSDESKELGSPTPVVVTKPSINQRYGHLKVQVC